MENDDLKKSLKFELTKEDFYELRKKAISNSVDRYELERYQHILREKRLIKGILETCKDVDEETKLKYSNILEQLEIEQRNYIQKCIERNRKNRNKKDEKEEENEK